jgi:phospholipid/cholesterol/gamma-HCH transport system substrate-binding protein
MDVGAPVRYRGVTVGRVTQTRPKANGVEVEVDISSADLIIPKDVLVQANQSGLLGETSIDITPTRKLTASITAKPLDTNCDATLILCHKSRLAGELGISVDELIRTSVRFANQYTEPQFFANVNSVVQNTSVAATEIAKLSREFTSLTKDVHREIATFSASARAISQTAGQLGLTATQVNSLLATNRSTLVSTLNNLNQTSAQLRTTMGSFNAVLNRAEQGELLHNLETLSANAAQASANLRDASKALNSPSNLAVLQQTLDSARSTFQNAQKITADLDELTGDPAFRKNLRNLVNGLSGLVSSTQQLQQQAQFAQMLAPIAATANQMPPVSAPAVSPSPSQPETASVEQVPR